MKERRRCERRRCVTICEERCRTIERWVERRVGREAGEGGRGYEEENRVERTGYRKLCNRWWWKGGNRGIALSSACQLHLYLFQLLKCQICLSLL